MPTTTPSTAYIFDEVTDVTLTAFLAASERGDADCQEAWSSWLVREGHETYAYLTVDELLTAFATNSVEAVVRIGSSQPLP
jgi:hypothetical protein